MKTFLIIALLVASVVAEPVVSHFEDCEGKERKFINIIIIFMNKIKGYHLI